MPSSVFISFFRYLDSTSSLSSEAISTHSLWDLSGLLNYTSCTSVNWSQLTQLHRFITSFAMCHIEGVSQCCSIVYPHRWSASCGKNVRNMPFKPPSQKMCLFLLNLPFYLKLQALQTLILTVLEVEGAPEQAYPSKVWFCYLSFSDWVPYWAPV